MGAARDYLASLRDHFGQTMSQPASANGHGGMSNKRSDILTLVAAARPELDAINALGASEEASLEICKTAVRSDT